MITFFSKSLRLGLAGGVTMTIPTLWHLWGIPRDLSLHAFNEDAGPLDCFYLLRYFHIVRMSLFFLQSKQAAVLPARLTQLVLCPTPVPLRMVLQAHLRFARMGGRRRVVVERVSVAPCFCRLCSAWIRICHLVRHALSPERDPVVHALISA